MLLDVFEPRRRRLRVLAWALVGLSCVGCASTDTYWGRAERSPMTKADMSRYDQDVYDCVRESRQQMGFNDLQSVVERDAQRLYVLCMRAKGYTEH